MNKCMNICVLLVISHIRFEVFTTVFLKIVQSYAVSVGKYLLMLRRTVVLHLLGQAATPKTHPKCWYP